MLHTVREVVVIYPSQPFPHSPAEEAHTVLEPAGLRCCIVAPATGRVPLRKGGGYAGTAPSYTVYEASQVRCKISSTVDKK